MNRQIFHDAIEFPFNGSFLAHLKLISYDFKNKCIFVDRNGNRIHSKIKNPIQPNKVDYGNCYIVKVDLDNTVQLVYCTNTKKSV